MKMHSLIFGLLGILGASLPLMAQTPGSQPVPQPLLSGPLLNRAPESALWTVIISRTSSRKPEARREKGAPAELQQLTVAKSKTTYREERLLSDGTKSEVWRVGAMQISALPGSGELTIFEPSPSSIALLDPEAYTDYSKTDFPGFEWISKKNYRGVQELAGRPCLVFEEAASDPSGEAPEGAPQILRTSMAAWIDLETRLPVILQKGAKTNAYRFGTPPQGMLTLPPRIQSLLDRRAKALEMATRRPARPY